MKSKSKTIILSLLSFIVISSIIATTLLIIINQNNNIARLKKGAVWQTGPMKNKDKTELKDESELSYFFGETEFNYATYKKEKDVYSFYGDENNVKRTKIYNKQINLWKNDVYEEQLVLFKNVNTDNVKNLKIELIEENPNIEVTANIINYIENNNTTIANNDLIPLGEFYTFDEITNENQIENMNLSFQPVLLRYISKTNTGQGTLKFKVSYEINDINKFFYFNKNYKISNELEYKTSEFGSSAMFFPNTSSKFILKNLNDVVTKRKIIYKQEDNIDFEDYELLWKIIKKENPLLPIDSKVYNVEEKNGDMIVWLKSDSYKYVTSAGQQIDFINITFEKDKKTFQITNELLAKESKATKIINTQSFDIIDDVEKTLPRYLSQNSKVTRNNILGRKLEDMSKRSNYESISVPNFGLGNFIKYVFEPNENELNVVNHFMGDTLEEIFENTKNKGKWVLDFQVFDRYLKFLKESKVKNILIPIGSRGSSNMFNFYVKDSDKKAYQISANSLYVNKYGKITPDGISIIEQMIPLLRDQLAEHANLNKDIYEDMNIYYSYDEFSSEVNNLSIDIFKNINEQYKNFWKNHLYGGWEFKLESEDYEGLVKGLDVYDYVTLQQREFIYEFSKNSKKQNDLIKYFNKRNDENKITHIYSSWNNYPATYLNSNGFEMLWAMLYSNKIGAHGYDRYQVDGYQNDISLDQKVLNPTKEPGDSFYLYPGNEEEMFDSLRYINIVKGINLVNKSKQILLENPNFKEYMEILQFITVDEDRYLDEKWNLDYYDKGGTLYEKSLSGQSTYINWLIKNYKFK
ncbi:glycoside hydrolase domain-containing protein [Spiroplasma diminutum]|uniref:Glycoside hydrolase 123 catalytic domain-containing protein n=1 Tax=Spiroplasma diminutum CUAS-1 TaxID=1276221 RepID=S5LVJ1_9MOLU|nr:glycoside hydrolase domain-containing protein [Spiroplasma diminutum]AGR41834.1 hypothetical protein SDIMI_v3c01300 [Spiroplasma diminutum CUAS-1]